MFWCMDCLSVSSCAQIIIVKKSSIFGLFSVFIRYKDRWQCSMQRDWKMDNTCINLIVSNSEISSSVLLWISEFRPVDTGEWRWNGGGRSFELVQRTRVCVCVFVCICARWLQNVPVSTQLQRFISTFFVWSRSIYLLMHNVPCVYVSAVVHCQHVWFLLNLG